MSQAYDEILRFLFSRTAGRIKWSLGPTEALLDELGHPEQHFQSVHIGGTNGKGSVAAMVYEVLRSAGHRVGLYTSPHLVDVRERMIVDGRAISAEAFLKWAELLRPAVERTDASFFEATTALAFADFAARGVDVAVVEVGLGGRLDSTNVITPLVSAVTSVSLEHMDYLGPSLQSIALEKAGVAKPGVPFVIGESDASVVDVLRQAARERGAHPVVVPADATYAGAIGMAGEHQRRNGAVAEAVLLALPERLRPAPRHIECGLRTARLPGRMDRRGKWLFDVAHNPDAVEALAAEMRRTPPSRPVHALVGLLRDKDWRSILPKLRGVVDRLWLTTAPSAPADRRPDLEEWAAGAAVDVLEPNFDRALVDVQRGAGTVLVTGSFYTVGDALRRLPGFPPLG